MRDPGLKDGEFKRDLVQSCSRLVNPSDTLPLPGVSSTGDSFVITGTERFSLPITLRSSDLSMFNCLTVTLRNISEKPLLVGLTLKHGAQDSASELIGTSFSGDREILAPGQLIRLNFPIESFGIYGNPYGWANIREIELVFKTEKFLVGSKDFRIVFYGIEAEKRLVPEGPRLTMNGLRCVLVNDATSDYDLISPHVTLMAGSSIGTIPATDSMSPFSTQGPGLYICPPHSYPIEKASDLMRGRIMGQNLPQDIPWDANPLGELEWTHFLNRHHFLRTLIQEFVKTGNASIVQRISAIVETWIRQCPVPVDSNGGAGPTWETLTIAWRLREWLWIMGILWQSQVFSDEMKILTLRSIWEHAQSLVDHQGHLNNWIIVESAALALVGMLFPAFNQAQQWFETGISRLVKAYNTQFFPDGAHFELSPLYHSICIHALLDVRQVAETNRIPLPSIFYEPLEKNFEYLMEIARPDFTWPSINDSGSVDRDYCQLFVSAASVFKRPDFEWIASRGVSGKPPKRCLRVFPDAGICVLRTFDEKKPKCGLFRAGPAGPFHSHNDLLSLEIFDDKFSWLIDPGVTKYAPGILTSGYRSALSHNVAVIDGIEPNRMSRPILERIKSSRDTIRTWEDPDYVAVSCRSDELTDRDGNICVLERTLFFVKRSFWILREDFSGSGVHDVVHNWQFSGDVLKVDRTEPDTIVASNEYAQFVIRKIIPRISSEIDVVMGSLDPPRGWVSMGGNDHPAYSARYLTKTELPVVFLWMFHGLGQDASSK